VSADVVVVGSGLAGLSAALEAHKRGLKVAIMEKRVLGRGGASRMGRRFMVWSFEELPKPPPGSPWWQTYLPPAEDPQLDRKLSTVIHGDSQMAWRIALEMERMGMLFRRTDDGKLWPEPCVGLHSMKTDRVGVVLTNLMSDEVRRRDIIVLEETMAIRILKHGGKAVGVVGWDKVKGEVVTVIAKAVVLATGSAAFCLDSVPPLTLTGDGYALALRAGAELTDMCELPYYNYWNKNIEPKNWSINIAYWTNRPFNPEGPLYLNSLGQNIFEKDEYKTLIQKSVALGMDGKRVPLPHYVILHIIASELKLGRGSENHGIYISYKHMKYAPKLMKRWWATYDYLKKVGLDPSRDLLEIGLQPHISQGGIVVDGNFETSVPGLFAIGGCATYFGISMAACIASGKWVMEKVEERVKSGETTDFESVRDQVKEEENRIETLLQQAGSGGVHPAAIKHMLRDIMTRRCHFWKNEKDLLEAANEIRRIKEDALPKMRLRTRSRTYNQDLVEAFECQNLLDICEIFVEMSLRKRESRGTWQREDYPEQMKRYTQVFVKQVDGKKIYRERAFEMPGVIYEGWKMPSPSKETRPS